MNKSNNFVIKRYLCKICNETHDIKLDKNICKGHSRFPFPKVFLHGELKNILTTLYIDQDLRIRGVDVYKLADDDLFSKEQATIITKTLMMEIERLTEENIKLSEENKKLKKK